MQSDDQGLWAVILGGSSGFGLASAKRLAHQGYRICIVHRDRKGAMHSVNEAFEEIEKVSGGFVTHNLDALNRECRQAVLNDLEARVEGGKVKVLLHSIAFGSLKPLAPPKIEQADCLEILSQKLKVDETHLRREIGQLFEAGADCLHNLVAKNAAHDQLLLDEEELLSTIYAMGGSILGWTREIFERGLFSPDARVIGLTSEGNQTAWLGYAAVSAAKAALEALSRSIAREFGPHGIRSNIVQPGVTDTKALRLIPGSSHMCAQARLKNPLGRLTEVDDVANVISFLASDDAAWINGSILRVDGGEHISGM